MTSRPAAASPDLGVSLGPLRLKNPVMAASGTFGYGLELAGLCPPGALGAVITKGLSLEPWKGNPAPRIAEAAGGLLNAIGLENVGLAAFLEKSLGPLKATGATVGVNVLGRTPDDYAILSRTLSDTAADFIELNVSCPNLRHPGGLSLGSDPDALSRITAQSVKAAAGKPVVVKLPPLVTDVADLARRAEEAGATAISLINSLPGLSLDLETRRPSLGNGPGGLSGPPVKPLALRQVMLCSRAVSIPVIGLGGIMGHLDALEFIVAGATAVQVGTGILVDPTLPLSMIRDMSDWLSRRGLQDLGQLRGSLRL
ncbi:MAG: dihydroorotate dehydrogenase [Deltaproteobacteria bacterium]|nr:dihydroorotate dehydrogenase [Deltaproteobacteria bacterium]